MRRIVFLFLFLLPSLSLAGEASPHYDAPGTPPFTGGTLTSPLLLPDGSSNVPSIGFTSDADGTGTGVFRNGTNQYAISVNGTMTGRWQAGKLQLVFGADLDVINGGFIYSSDAALHLGGTCDAAGNTGDACFAGLVVFDEGLELPNDKFVKIGSGVFVGESSGFSESPAVVNVAGFQGTEGIILIHSSSITRDGAAMLHIQPRVVGSNGLTGSTGESQFGIMLSPTLAQTDTAAFTAIFVDVTETTIGSGPQNLMDLQIATASKFLVDREGNVTIAGAHTYHGGGFVNLGGSVTPGTGGNTLWHVMTGCTASKSLNGMTHSNCQVTITNAGTYKVAWNASFTGVTGETYMGGIELDVGGTPTPDADVGCQDERKLAGADVGSMGGGVCIITATAGQTLDVEFKSDGSNATEMTVTSFDFTITQL